MNKLYVTGDIHGNLVQRISYKKHPELRFLDTTDVIIFCGDFGIPFGINMPDYKRSWYKKDKYELEQASKKPFTILALCGNHSDRDAIKQMPIVEKFGMAVHQMKFDNKMYDNIFYIDTPQIANINDYHCLFIPGAASRDIDVILESDEDNLKNRMKVLNDKGVLYRVNHWTWWENEDVDTTATYELMNTDNNFNKHYDFVFTHESPALWELNGYGGGPRSCPTEGQTFLESLRKHLDFDAWFHGHQHMDFQYPEDERIICVYHDVFEL